jgi:ADP-ribose pyrophosphatase YjhB (NUDIX family)
VPRFVPDAFGRLAYRCAYVALRVYSRVVRPHTRGVKCIIVDGDGVLLVRHSYGPGQWDLPGGFCRRSEAFEAAARRELGEELGIADGATVFALGELRRDFQGRHETLHGFRVEPGGRELAAQSIELAEIGWFDREGLPADRGEAVDAIIALDAGFRARGRG